MARIARVSWVLTLPVLLTVGLIARPDGLLEAALSTRPDILADGSLVRDAAPVPPLPAIPFLDATDPKIDSGPFPLLPFLIPLLVAALATRLFIERLRPEEPGDMLGATLWTMAVTAALVPHARHLDLLGWDRLVVLLLALVMVWVLDGPTGGPGPLAVMFVTLLAGQTVLAFAVPMLASCGLTLLAALLFARRLRPLGAAAGVTLVTLGLALAAGAMSRLLPGESWAERLAACGASLAGPAPFSVLAVRFLPGVAALVLVSFLTRLSRPDPEAFVVQRTTAPPHLAPALLWAATLCWADPSGLMDLARWAIVLWLMACAGRHTGHDRPIAAFAALVAVAMIAVGHPGSAPAPAGPPGDPGPETLVESTAELGIVLVDARVPRRRLVDPRGRILWMLHPRRRVLTRDQRTMLTGLRERLGPMDAQRTVRAWWLPVDDPVVSEASYRMGWSVLPVNGDSAILHRITPELPGHRRPALDRRTNLEDYLSASTEALSRGHMVRAVWESHQALLRYRQDPRARLLLGKALLLLDQRDEARDVLTEILRLPDGDQYQEEIERILTESPRRRP